MWAGIILGVLVVVGLYTRGFGLFGGKKVEAHETPARVRTGNSIAIPDGSPLRARINVIPAPSEEVSSKLSLPAVVEVDPTRTAAVLTPLGGRLSELKVALGDRVARGQILAVIESPDFAQAYDDDDKAADLLALTEKTLARQEEQFKIGTASAHDLDQARSDRAQALAEHTRTQARLKAIGASGNAGARQLAVRAPVSGSVTVLSVARGNMINDPTQPIMTIADLSTVWVTALVAEKDIASVSKGQDVEVRLGAYPERVLPGKVLFVPDVLEPDSRRAKIRVAFANADNALKPNMFATVTLLGTKQTRVVLPTSALLMNNDRTSVFVATAPWTFERRTVEPQLEEGAKVVINSGVKPGEQVVVKGGILLND